jgi:hypothetical protein
MSAEALIAIISLLIMILLGLGAIWATRRYGRRRSGKDPSFHPCLEIDWVRYYFDC